MVCVQVIDKDQIDLGWQDTHNRYPTNESSPTAKTWLYQFFHISFCRQKQIVLLIKNEHIWVIIPVIRIQHTFPNQSSGASASFPGAQSELTQ